MKFSYEFSNLLGSIYRNGNVVFTSDGNTIISPVGNRLSIYNLKNNTAQTLSLQSRYNYTNIALSPEGNLLCAVNDVGEAQFINLTSSAIIYKHKFQTKIQFANFSPDGKYLAIGRENFLLIFQSPGATGDRNHFNLHRHYLGGYDDITWIDWSSDSRFLAIGCRDNSTKIVATQMMNNFRSYTLGGHTEPIVGCFFERDSLDVNTVSKNGQLCLWKCSLPISEITECKDAKNAKKTVKKRKEDSDDSEDEIENTVGEVEVKVDKSKAAPVDENDLKNLDEIKVHPFSYSKQGRRYLADELRKTNPESFVTAVSYHSRSKLMVVAFSTGLFYLYELPDVNVIHSLSISDYAISSVIFNSTGEWVALASRELGQLIIWEWQSEQYILKQQGHTGEMTCLSYSPDGQCIATGGDDAKLKLWNMESNFCFVTFSEHTSIITGVQFSKKNKFIVSSSYDGTVRAFDLSRYRNFRVFTCPQLVQFACVGIDSSSELVAAGGQDVFEVYLWSIKTGKLLEVISGHEAPVSSLEFSPLLTSSMLVTGSWDKTIKIWNCLESDSSHETIEVLADAINLAFNPNGEHVAVATLKGHILIFDVKSATQISTIEGRNDLGSTVSETDIVSAKNNLEGQYFTSIEYSADGECILAAGKSNFICIYHAQEAVLLKTFEITENHSLDGLEEYMNRRNLSEFGNMALLEKRDDTIGKSKKKLIRDARSMKLSVKVSSVKFSPTGQSFAAACTEGLLVYSLERGLIFDPLNLGLDVTPMAITKFLKEQEYAKALITSVKLGEEEYIRETLESVPYKRISLICSTLPDKIAQKLLEVLARFLQKSPHIQLYLEWSVCLLGSHGNKDGVFQSHSLVALHESLSRKYESLNQICNFNIYTLRALIKAGTRRNLNEEEHNSLAEASSDSEMEVLIPLKLET